MLVTVVHYLLEVFVKHSDASKALIQSLLRQFIEQHDLSDRYVETAQKWFIPLANRISEHQKSAGRPVIVGINGCQGSGKSTLTSLLVNVLNDVFNKPTIGFSIDDFYLPLQQRISLSKSISPLLRTRGAPGTHDIISLETKLKQLLAGESVYIPSFDKSLDDVTPSSQWTPVKQAQQIIILEGWCVGIQSQHQKELLSPINDLEKLEDERLIWRQYVNEALSVDYERVFALIDYMVMLKAPSFEQVFTWRCEQEHKLIKSLHSTHKHTKTMSDSQISNFIQYYQRLTQHAFTTLPEKCNSLFTLDSSRSIKACLHK